MPSPYYPPQNRRKKEGNAKGENRTLKPFRTIDFESIAFTCFATLANTHRNTPTHVGKMLIVMSPSWCYEENHTHVGNNHNKIMREEGLEPSRG